MSTKIGPIQTGEEKTVAFDFVNEGISGSLSSPTVLVTTSRGQDAEPSEIKVGDASVQGLRVVQKVRYRNPDVTYLLQCTATDSLGLLHTVSAYLQSRDVA